MRPTLIALVTFTTLAAGWLTLLRNIPSAPEPRWIESIYRIKESASRDVLGQKVMLIGGSATLFGFSAEQASKETGLSFVNFGTHAGLGASYILYRARSALRPGDVAVLTLEYTLPTRPEATATLASHFAYNDIGYLQHAPLSAIPELTFGLRPVQLLRDSLVQRIPGSFVPPVLSSYGDETRNTEPTEAQRRAAVNVNYPLGVGFGADFRHRYIRSFIEWCEQNRIRVIFIPPPVYVPEQFRAEVSADKVSERISAFFSSHGAQPGGVLEDYMMSADDIFDTNYHANARGRRKVTNQLVKDVCRIVGCPKSAATQPRTDAP